MNTLQDNNSCVMQFPGCWRENSGLNVSLADRYQLSIGDDAISIQVKKKTYFSMCYKHMCLLFLMSISGLAAIFPLVMLNVYEKSELDLKVRNSLGLLRYIGFFSFSGGVATLISLLLSLSAKAPACAKFSANFLNERTQIVRHFLDDIFSEEFMWQYSRRTKNVQDNDNSQALISFLESNEFDIWISKKFQSMVNTPQGILLDILDIDHDEACSTFKLFVMKTILEFPKQINNVLMERLNSESTQVNLLTQQVVLLQIDYIVGFVIIIMGIFGSVFGAIITFSS